MKNRSIIFTFMIFVFLLFLAFQAKSQDDVDSFCLRDDQTGDFVLVNPRSGNYEFTSCSQGRTIGGRGNVSSDSCLLKVRESTSLRTVSIEINRCLQGGAASFVAGATVEIFSLHINDLNFDDSICSCALVLHAKGTYNCDLDTTSATGGAPTSIEITAECGDNCSSAATYTTKDGKKYNCKLSKCDGCPINK